MTVWDTTGKEHTMQINGGYVDVTARCSCGWSSSTGHWYDVRLEARTHQHDSDTFCIGCFEHYHQHREGCEGIKRVAVA